MDLVFWISLSKERKEERTEILKDIEFKGEFGSDQDCKFRKSRMRGGVLADGILY